MGYDLVEKRYSKGPVCRFVKVSVDEFHDYQLLFHIVQSIAQSDSKGA